MAAEARDIPGLIAALGVQRQCDEDGVLVAVSRQAVDEAIAALRDLAAANAKIAALENTNSALHKQMDTEVKAANAKLAAKPDVAGLVDAYDEARYHFEDWTGGADTPSKQAELKRRVDAKDAARQRIQDALLSLSAQLRHAHQAKTIAENNELICATELDEVKAQLAKARELSVPGSAKVFAAMEAQLAEKEAECEGLLEALKHQRTALSLVRERQCHDGVCTVALSDIEKGIAQLDSAIAARKP